MLERWLTLPKFGINKPLISSEKIYYNIRLNVLRQSIHITMKSIRVPFKLCT